MGNRNVASPRVLVVDDDPLSRRLVRAGLERMTALEIHEAQDGTAAQALLAQQPFDLVITDLLMPGVDGLELMHWAKESCPGPVWVILSSLDTFDAAVEAIQLGAFDFLAKPLGFHRLDLTVRNALQHRQLLLDKEAMDADLRRRVQQLEDMCRILQDQAEVIRRDLRRAEVIQRALLPHSAPAIQGFTLDSVYRPGHNVGGDLYDVAVIDDDHVVVYVADAAGHGVSAAMLSVLLKQRLQMIDETTGKPLSPGEALAAVNRHLVSEVAAPGMFVTVAYCLLNTRSGELVIASAGHLPLCWLRASGATSIVERTGPALGLDADATFGEHHLDLARGDRVLLYTDGLVDETSGPLLQRQSLAAVLARKDLSGSSLLAELHHAAGSSIDDRDDVTMVLLQAANGASVFDNGCDVDETPRPAGGHASSSTLLYGETGDSTCISVRGRGTWKQSDTFYGAARDVLDARRLLTLDFSSCEYLDSTFLGTVHEVVAAGEDAMVDIRLQGIPDGLRRLFEQLSMGRVIRHFDDETRPIPAMMHPLSAKNHDTERRHDRILRAHEVLSSLSDQNRAEFLAVVESLRAEVSR